MIQTPLMKMSVIHTLAVIRDTEYSLTELTLSNSLSQKFGSLLYDQFPEPPVDSELSSGIGPLILFENGKTMLVTPKSTTPKRNV